MESERLHQGEEKPTSEQRTEAERLGLLDRLKTIIRVVSGRMDLHITTDLTAEQAVSIERMGQDPAQTWFRWTEHDQERGRTVKKELVRIPPELLESEMVAQGKAAHEAVHVRITRFGEFVPEVVMQELGFSSLLHAAEERPTDQGVRFYHPPATPWIDEARQDEARKVKLPENSKEEDKLKKMSSLPRFVQLCNLVVYAPHYKPEVIQKICSPEVIQAYEEIQSDIERAEHTLPSAEANAEETRAKAIERYKIVYKDIWPKVKNLVKQDQQEELLNQVAESQPEKLKMLLEETEGDELEGDIIGKLVKALQQIFDDLPKKEKKKLMKQARQVLEQTEDKVVEQLRGQLLDQKVETHKEYRERIAREHQSVEEAKSRQERMKKVAEQIEKLLGKQEKEKPAYEKAYQEVREFIDALYGRLDEIFHPTIAQSKRLHSSGSRPHLPSIFRRSAARAAGAKEVPSKVFEKKDIPEERDYAFMIGIDVSGSMTNKLWETFKTAVAIVEVLNRIGIPCGVFTFGSGVKKYKGLDGILSEEVRAHIGQIADTTKLERETNTPDKIALAVKLKQPCLLEGPTAASKTSAIEYLAMLTGHGVLRINLSGQSDTSELIGKFVPNDGRLAIAFDELVRAKDTLSDESKQIIEKAEATGRGFTEIESRTIAGKEGLSIPEWRWKDGVVPRGLKEGLWVILDEWNLAEQDVRERLNPVLESPPSLLLTENGDASIGPKGDHAVHEESRFFATLNPADAEYAKRKPMSPAESDRWGAYLQVGSPHGKQYQEMLVNAVFGKQPDIEMRGEKYFGFEGESQFPLIHSLKKEEVEKFLVALSNFHAKLAEMAHTREIGKDRKQKYIFTRRGLIEFLSFLENAHFITDRKSRKETNVQTNPKEIIQRAIKYYYLDRVNPEDHNKVETVLALYGLTSSGWGFKF